MLGGAPVLEVTSGAIQPAAGLATKYRASWAVIDGGEENERCGAMGQIGARIGEAQGEESLQYALLELRVKHCDISCADALRRDVSFLICFSGNPSRK